MTNWSEWARNKAETAQDISSADSLGDATNLTFEALQECNESQSSDDGVNTDLGELNKTSVDDSNELDQGSPPLQGQPQSIKNAMSELETFEFIEVTSPACTVSESVDKDSPTLCQNIKSIPDV